LHYCFYRNAGDEKKQTSQGPLERNSGLRATFSPHEDHLIGEHVGDMVYYWYEEAPWADTKGSRLN